MLVIDSVTLSYFGNKVLSNCYLHCESGEVVGLLGRNGSGKSSLLKVIFGSLPADYKHLRIDDVIISKAYKAGKVAYLPQQPFWLRHLKVKDLLNGLPPEIIDELFALENLHITADHQIGNLSHANKEFWSAFGSCTGRPGIFCLMNHFLLLPRFISNFCRK